jgi:hypothetical protein
LATVVTGELNLWEKEELKMRNKNVAIMAVLLAALVILVLLWADTTVAGPPLQAPKGGDDETQTIVVEDGFWYQGRLTDGDGNPLANTEVNVTFRIYSVPFDGTALASTEIGVDTDKNGLFNEVIDFHDHDLFNGQELYLGLQVQGEASEMTSRQYLRAVPYAMSIRPGAIISTSNWSSAYDPVLEIRNDAAVGGDLDGLLVFSESDGEAIEGRSRYGMGVYGATQRSGQTEVAGVYGFANNEAPGVRGQSQGTDVDNSYGGYFNSTSRRGLYATGGPSYYAAWFVGGGAPSNNGIYVVGNVDKTGTNNAAVPIEGQGTRRMYSIESPNVWFEDFGQSQLAGGQATVAFEPLFLQTINTEAPYHVFLTPMGDCNGLYVTSKTPTSFEVRELGGGASSVAFDYRIVAVRKDYEGVRMELITEGSQPLVVGSTIPSPAPEPEEP